MIFGIGTDIVQVSRIAALFERYSESFPRRILTSAEFNEFSASKWPAYFLAKRFAAKEAASKALGTGFGRGVQPCHIGVSHTDQGQPILEWEGRTKALVQRFGIDQALLSLADEKEHAVAFVILMTTAGIGKFPFDPEEVPSQLKFPASGQEGVISSDKRRSG